MKAKIYFGKIAYQSTRKINPVEIEIELRETTQGEEFACSAWVWNSKRTQIVGGGQCLDSLPVAELENKGLFVEIKTLWHLYHLNTLHAGTRVQERAVKDYFEETGKKYDYAEACNYLKSCNLYEVEHNGKPYKYGHAWIYEAIPQTDLNRIKEIINTHN